MLRPGQVGRGARGGGATLEDLAHRDRAEDEVLPWDHLSAGLHKDFLWTDWQDALRQVAVEDCRWTPCYDCGACTDAGLEHVVASGTPPAGGSQGTGQDLSSGDRVPVRFVTSRRGGARCPTGADPVQQAGQGPLHQPPRCRPDVGTRPASQRRGRRAVPGLLTPGPSSPSGSHSRPAQNPWPSISTSTLAEEPAVELGELGLSLSELLPEGLGVSAAGHAAKCCWLIAARSNIVFLGAGGARRGRIRIGEEGRAVARRSERFGAPRAQGSEV